MVNLIAPLNAAMPTNSNGSSTEAYEGNYARALRRARHHYEEAVKLGSAQEATNFLPLIKNLEEKLLTQGFLHLLFDENNQPRVKLLQLLELVGMEPLNPSEKAVLQINEWAQKNLLRQGERWQAQTERFEALKLQIKPLLTELNFVEATLPHFKEYQGAIVHGGLLPRVRLCIHYLVEQWTQSVRFSHLYFFSGERPLEVQESRAALMQDESSPLKIRQEWVAPLEFPKTECEMMQFVWEQSAIPEDMRQAVEIHFINAPLKKDSTSGRWLRPTTDDTVEAWLKTQPMQGRYLAIAKAPYTNRQDSVVRLIAPKTYQFDTIGPGANEQEKVAIFLDEVARFIFQTKQASEKS
jgi:hypothetical protein